MKFSEDEVGAFEGKLKMGGLFQKSAGDKWVNLDMQGRKMRKVKL